MEFGSLRIKNIQSILQYKPSAKRWSSKNRKNHIVGIILDGAAFHDFGYQKFTLSKNSVYFLNQKDDYDACLQTESSRCFSIHFTTFEPIVDDSFYVSLANPDEIISILQKAEKAYSAENELLLMSILYQLCYKIGQLRERAYFPMDQRIHAAKEYIDLHFKEADCISAAIRKSKLSSRRFGELFRKQFELTPTRYVNFRKIEYAKKLLSTEAISVTDAAALCGFIDIYYFSKVFKNLAGISPSKWKQRQAADNIEN